MRPLIFAALFTAAVTPTHADELSVKLRDGAGLEIVTNNCTACHSLDYMVMNSPFPSRAMWQAEVGKMIRAYGADISDGDAKLIVDYLAKNYGS